jgi:hypothetical protein
VLNNKVGYIDKASNVVIPPQFDNIYNFSEDLAAVKKGEKWGYINKSGKLVIKPQFDSALPFSQGLAKVKIGNKYGYIRNPLQ